MTDKEKTEIEQAVHRFVKEYGKTLMALADDCWHEEDGTNHCKACKKELTLMYGVW